MMNASSPLKFFRRQRRASALLETAFLAGLLAAVSIGAMMAAGIEVGQVFSRNAAAVGDANVFLRDALGPPEPTYEPVSVAFAGKMHDETRLDNDTGTYPNTSTISGFIPAAGEYLMIVHEHHVGPPVTNITGPGVQSLQIVKSLWRGSYSSAIIVWIVADSASDLTWNRTESGHDSISRKAQLYDVSGLTPDGAVVSEIAHSTISAEGTTDGTIANVGANQYVHLTAVLSGEYDPHIYGGSGGFFSSPSDYLHSYGPDSGQHFYAFGRIADTAGNKTYTVDFGRNRDIGTYGLSVILDRVVAP